MAAYESRGRPQPFPQVDKGDAEGDGPTEQGRVADVRLHRLDQVRRDHRVGGEVAEQVTGDPIGHPQRPGEEGAVSVLHHQEPAGDERGRTVRGGRGRGRRHAALPAQLEGQAGAGPAAGHVVVEIAVEALEAAGRGRAPWPPAAGRRRPPSDRSPGPGGAAGSTGRRPRPAPPPPPAGPGPTPSRRPPPRPAPPARPADGRRRPRRCRDPGTGRQGWDRSPGAGPRPRAPAPRPPPGARTGRTGRRPSLGPACRGRGPEGAAGQAVVGAHLVPVGAIGAGVKST